MASIYDIPIPMPRTARPGGYAPATAGSNPMSGFANGLANHANLLLALGSGLLSGKNWAQGLANAGEAGMQGAQVDRQNAKDQAALDQQNADKQAVTDWIKQNAPQYAALPSTQGFQLALNDIQAKQAAARAAAMHTPQSDPASVQEYKYFSALPPEQQAAYLRMKRSNPYLDIGTGYVQPDPINPGQTSGAPIDKNNIEAGFQNQTGKDIGTQFVDQRKAALDAQASLTANQQAVKLLDSGIISGFGADFKVGLGKALQSAGINIAPDAIANTEAFTAQRVQETGRLIQMFGAGTGLSDADRAYAAKAAAGDINLTEESIRRILDINNRAAENVIKLYNQQVDQMKAGGLPDLSVTAPTVPATGGNDGWTDLGNGVRIKQLN